jgi:hypothetical protein
MIFALRKIEGRGELPGATSTVVELCIDNPREVFSDLFATAPSVDARAQARVKFAGGYDRGRLGTVGAGRPAGREPGSIPPVGRGGRWAVGGASADRLAKSSAKFPARPFIRALGRSNRPIGTSLGVWAKPSGAGLSSFSTGVWPNSQAPDRARHGVKDTGSDYSHAVALRIEFSLVSAMFAPKAGRGRDGRASDLGA